MSFGTVLKKLRTKKGISIKKMAPEVELDYTYISKMENSKALPSQKVVEKLSEYFQYDSDELTMMAGKIPEDIEHILKNNPKEAIEYLRRKFGGGK